MQKLTNALADLDKQLELRRKDEADLKRDLTFAVNTNDEVRLQLFNQRAREEKLQKDGRVSETTYALLTAELGKWKKSKLAASRVELKERAQVPKAPQLDRKLKIVGGVALAMFGLVACGVFFFDFRERRVYAQQDVARGLGLRVIGTLPISACAAGRPKRNSSPCSNRPTRCARCCCRPAAMTASVS